MKVRALVLAASALVLGQSAFATSVGEIAGNLGYSAAPPEAYQYEQQLPPEMAPQRRVAPVAPARKVVKHAKRR